VEAGRAPTSPQGKLKKICGTNELKLKGKLKPMFARDPKIKQKTDFRVILIFAS
jgi:hypothetical protein